MAEGVEVGKSSWLDPKEMIRVVDRVITMDNGCCRMKLEPTVFTVCRRMDVKELHVSLGLSHGKYIQ